MKSLTKGETLHHQLSDKGNNIDSDEKVTTDKHYLHTRTRKAGSKNSIRNYL